MNVEIINPNTVALRVSEKAQRHITKEVTKRNALGLRLFIEKSGCSGFRYKLDFVTQANSDDLRVAINDDVGIYISKQDQAYVNNMEIDFVTEGLNSSFQFRNPNASGTCGCGESFAVSQ